MHLVFATTGASRFAATAYRCDTLLFERDYPTPREVESNVVS